MTLPELAVRVDAVRNAETHEARLKAAARLGEIPLEDIPEALAQVQLIEGRNLTLVAKLLLIRWAADDGEAAANWAWTRFRSEGVWHEAFKEITASWAWNQPAKLCEWTKRLAKEHKPSFGDISLADAKLSKTPILEFSLLDLICFNLVSVAPREAFEILQIRGGYSSEDTHLFDSLQTVAAVREGLLAFDNLDQLKPDDSQGPDMFAKSLLHRWKELDPGDFSRSPYAALVPDWSASLTPPPIPDGPRGWVREFHAWHQSSPAARPDMTGWPAAKQQAWEDLETLMPGGRH
jgi:hypothetical protein